MVDIKDTTILPTGFSEKIESVSDVSDNNYIDDDQMDNLAYSDSESTSIAMPDDEFCDALDQLSGVDNPASKENGKVTPNSVRKIKRLSLIEIIFYSSLKTVPVAENLATPTEINEKSTELMEKKMAENVEIQCEKSNGNTENGELETGKLFENDDAEKSPALAENLNGINEDDEPVLCKTSTIDSEPEIKSIETDELKVVNENAANEIAANENAANHIIERENANSNQSELCNGDIQEAILDNTSNIDVPTPNEDADGVEGDFDFDQIYDDLQEKNKASESNEQNDLKLSSASESNETSDEKMETEKTTETITANCVKDVDEDELLKSPSMQENCEQDSDLAKYSESVLLKDDTKDEMASDDVEESITVLDSTDELMETSIIDKSADASEEAKEKNKTNETENENEHSMNDVFDQLKTSATVNETSSSETANLVDVAPGNVIEKSTNETENSTIDIQNEDSGKPTETADLPALVAESSSDSENKDNKENNLLEVMPVSPVSADNVESSSSSFRDDDVPNGDEFCDPAVDLKDENSTDARDGFNDDKNAEEIVASNANKTESNDVSQLNENSVISTDQMDSNSESKTDVTKELNEKSNESLVAINLDDDDDLIIDDSSSSETNKTESNEDDQPPAKRARIEITESEESLSKSLESEALTCEENLATDATVEAEKPEKLANEKPEQSKVEDDDDIVIIESNEPKAPSEVVNSNKRPASPVTIDSEEESRKKLKPDASDAIPAEDSTKSEEPEVETPQIPQSDTLDVVLKTDEETKIEDTVKSSTEEEKTIVKECEKNEEKIEPKFELKPKPEESVKRTIALDFAEKFKKSLNQMSRKNLEEFVLEKIVEAVVHKSDYSELKQRSEAQEKQIQMARTKLQEISKQYRDLEMVYARLKKDLENKNQNIVTPIKITRAVGLQVCLQKVTNKEASTAATAAAPAPAPPKTVQKTYTTTAQTVTRAASVLAASAQSKVAPVQKPVAPVQRQPMRAIATRQVTPEQRVLTTSKAFVIHRQNETLLRRNIHFSGVH